MKAIVVSILVMSSPFAGTAQGLGEVFNQNKTQTKYLLAQIAALKVYIGYLEKGYDIAKKGLTTIGDLKNGEFKLHTGYFASLQKVNPAILRYKKVKSITDVAAAIQANCRATMKGVEGSEYFDQEEKTYLRNLSNNISAAVAENLDALSGILTSQQLELTDDERISRIDNIYSAMQNLVGVNKKFTEDTQSIMAMRKEQLNDGKTVRQLYNVSIP